LVPGVRRVERRYCHNSGENKILQVFSDDSTHQIPS
jgi:hypothetical protein